MQPDFFDNRARIVKDDLVANIADGDRVAIAASVFSMYAYQELAAQLEGIDELRFVSRRRRSPNSAPRARSANSTSRGFPESRAFAAPTSRSSCATSSRRRPSRPSAPTGSAARRVSAPSRARGV